MNLTTINILHWLIVPLLHENHTGKSFACGFRHPREVPNWQQLYDVASSVISASRGSGIYLYAEVDSYGRFWYHAGAIGLVPVSSGLVRRGFRHMGDTDGHHGIRPVGHSVRDHGYL